MSGRRVSVIADYGVDADGRFSVALRVIWPMLRKKPADVRGYLKRTVDDGALPEWSVEGEKLPPVAVWPVESVRFDGVLTITHASMRGLQLVRELFPSPAHPAVLQRCTLHNQGARSIGIQAWPRHQEDQVDGPFITRVAVTAASSITLQPGDSASFGMAILAGGADQPLPDIDVAKELQQRRRWLAGIDAALQLHTPSKLLNTAFALAKIRAAESVFDTTIGLVHSPGGERYYAGVWANDQAEYAGPFFPFLGDAAAIEASLNAYRLFQKSTNPQFERLPYAFEVEGHAVMRHVDRGDAAMVAYGAARFALASGDPAIGEELLPLIDWCLEYCRRHQTVDGVIASESDELEGRFPSGDANLSTASLAYGGLLSAAHLARALGRQEKAHDYDRRAAALAIAIERHFGGEVEGFETYRYYTGNEVLRAWICLPLTMGITGRAGGTIDALFSSRLWGKDGLATVAGSEDFWDRSTLYALRGVLAAGDVQAAMPRLEAYTRRRLLGEHVPYPVEAYPEGNQAHLSAESALYCRIHTEGFFGITPTGFGSFTCAPRLPEGWNQMSLRAIRAFGHTFDLTIARRPDRWLRVIIDIAGHPSRTYDHHPNQPLSITLPQ